jgi:crotonobetainyl-CoA:carnitine CoA-transferase CaiB-like acyl-CoA transferase
VTEGAGPLDEFRGAFEGVRVVEVSAWVMVPGAGVLLADLGADVVKIEHPRTGDPARALVTGGAVPAVGTVNVMVEQTNRGKRSIGLDISQPDGREVLLDLVRGADVFLTSLLPAVREKLRIDVDDLREVNQQLIYAKADAVGSTGPDAGKPGFDSAVFFGRGGILHSFRNGGDPPQPRPGFGDKTAALSLAYAVAAALFKRQRTGTPSVVETSLLASAMWVASSDIIYSRILDEDFSAVERTGTNPLAFPYRTSDGRWIMLSMISSDRWWPEFCDVLGRTDLLTDRRFATSRDRSSNASELAAELSSTFASQPLAHWVDRLAGLRAPWEVISTPREVAGDHQAVANGFIDDVAHPSGVEFPAVRSPVVFDGTPHQLHIAPEAWEHTEQVLLEIGCDWDRIIALKSDGVVP